MPAKTVKHRKKKKFARRQKTLTARFYETVSGNKPARDWLLGLTADDRKKVGEDIRTVEFGWPIGMPTCRKLEKGLWEVRSDLSDGTIGRVIFTITDPEHPENQSFMVLLHGFGKKSQKTPAKDLEIARTRLKEIQQ